MADWSGLRAFHAVAVAESFTRAARARGVSQPTLSAQVRNLEEAHGIRLFDRVGRTVRITEVGQRLFVITTRLMAAEDEAADFLAGTKALTRGHLRIAADSARHVMGVLAQFKTDHPGLTFALTIGNSTAVLDRVLAYEADLAITAKQVSNPRLHMLQLSRDRLIGFVRRDHPFARHDVVPIEAISGQDLVLRERGSVTREVFEARLIEASVRAVSLFEVQSREAVYEAVAAGLGVGVVFSAEFEPGAALHGFEISGVDLSVAEYAVCLEERRRIPLVSAFLRLLVSSDQPS